VSVTIGSGGTAQSFTAGPTDTSGNATYHLAQLLQPATSTAVSLTFAGDSTTTPQLASSTGSGSIGVSPDVCSVTYSGDAPVVLPLANTTLAATFADANAPAGDLSGHTIVFTLTNSALVTSTYQAVTDATGVASTSVPLAADSYFVHVSHAADSYYQACENAAGTDPLITVEQAASKATGGGWSSNGTGRFNFGFNLIPQAGGTYSGELQMANNSNKNKFHGRVITSASQLSSTKETWQGTGYWNGSAASFTITVNDLNSKSTKADTINLVIKKGSQTVFSTSGDLVIKGGNIVVH
jgi:hypothetical protein